MNGIKSDNNFITELENKVKEVKQNDERRREYMIMSAFEADARRVGISEGIRQGEAKGFADGLRQKALETARLMTIHNYPVSEICSITGLTQEEIEKTLT